MERTWITDDKGNRASVEHWGSEDAARASLKNLIACSACSDCSDCSDCSACSGCSDCYACSDCSDCSRCSDCSGCSDCYDCYACSACSDCSACSACSGEKRALPPIPVIQNIHQAVYAAVSKPDALQMNDWHTCDTTHCRGGWVIHLAGQEGYVLAKATSDLFAAQQIYKASGYEINPGRFFDSNDNAMADMKRLAEETTKA